MREHLSINIYHSSEILSPCYAVDSSISSLKIESASGVQSRKIRLLKQGGSRKVDILTEGKEYWGLGSGKRKGEIAWEGKWKKNPRCVKN